MSPEVGEHVTAPLPLRPRDRAMYLAALAVGLATARVSDEDALTTLTCACNGRHSDAIAARRRLFSSTLGAAADRREAARLLDIVCARMRAAAMRRPA
ncbi:MAG: hypothetical protein KY457_12245 [Actinobacteria bacterium]|nr:hypothetical protein [Actinomycetota bacterium]